MELNERQEKILKGVCRQYIKKASPVSSQVLKEKERLPFSSATIRIEFFRLQSKNYLFHPYISSGRVPTDKGFRFFVDKILKRKRKRTRVFQRNGFGRKFQDLLRIQDIERFSQDISDILGKMCCGLVFVYVPEKEILEKEGWQRVVREPEFESADYLKEFMLAVDSFEKRIDEFLKQQENIRVYIGKEAPFGFDGVSLIIKKSLFPKRKQAMIGIVGPKRMDFERNIGFLESMDFIFEKLA